MADTRKTIYGLYIQDWIDTHTTPRQRIDALCEYHSYLCECDKLEESPISFPSWIEENGYNGSLYVCFNEFLDAEYQDEDYIRTLIAENSELLKAYFNDVRSDESDSVDAALVWKYNFENSSHEMHIVIDETDILAASLRCECGIWVLRNFFELDNGIVTTKNLNSIIFCEAQREAKKAILEVITAKIEYYERIRSVMG